MTNDVDAMFDLNDFDVEANIPQYSSEKLADLVIAHRYLGLFQSTCELAMSELGKRRSNGDTFDFEGYITKNMETLPKLNFGKVNTGLTDLLNTVKGTLNDLAKR